MDKGANIVAGVDD